MTERHLNILILGGYGTFGGRVAQLLSNEERVTLTIAGRSREKAAAFCRRFPSGARKLPLAFDRERDVEDQLREIKPDIVVDATGPFQSYGDDPYRVVKACLALGIDYMDLADGSGFVKGIGQFDEEARARNVLVLSGVSSFPVLTAAVVRHLSQGLARIDTIRGGIAPSPYAGVGLNVIRAIAGYSGRPVALIRDGRESVGHALTEAMRYTISPPGRLPLRSTRFSLVDVPDLQVLPELWPDLTSVWMGAGPVPEVLHRALNGLAWLVRLRLLPSLAPLAPLFHRVINVLRWGEHRGGMFVVVEGRTSDSSRVERSWHLLAEGDDGPLIPSMAVEAIIRRCLEGRRPAAGARPATRDLELADYDALFERRAIYTGCREVLAGSPRAPLYQRLLGDAWTALPEPLKAMHGFKDELTAEGVGAVERGPGLLPRLIATLFGFPRAGHDLPVKVRFRSCPEGEVWTRIFAGRSFSSVQTEGRGRSERLLSERFGPFTFGLALVLDAGKLRLVVRRWSVFGLPLPAFLAPGGIAYESAEGGCFRFHVEIAHPLTGLIVRYRGWLAPRGHAAS